MPARSRSAEAKRKLFKRFVAALRISDEDIMVLTDFPEASQTATKAIKAIVVSPKYAFSNLKRDTRMGMGSVKISKAINADVLEKLLSMLDITYEEMEVVNTSPEAREAARRAIRAIIAPPRVALLRALLRGRYAYRLYSPYTPSDFYRAALNLDVNKLLGQERLTEAGRRIIRFRYGFVTGQPETLDATAEHFALTREELSELIDEALYCLDWKWMQECGADI